MQGRNVFRPALVRKRQLPFTPLAYGMHVRVDCKVHWGER